MDKKEKDLKEEVKEEVKEETVSEETENASPEKETEAPKVNKEEEEDLKNKYMRLMADFQNFKRRSEEKRFSISTDAKIDALEPLLDVIDNFERALEAGKDNQEDSFYQGMELIFKQLLAVLDKAGVEEIKALGEDFDPNFHNAVMMEDSTEYESGKVTSVLQKGYVLNKRVIRPSMVKVAN